MFNFPRRGPKQTKAIEALYNKMFEEELRCHQASCETLTFSNFVQICIKGSNVESRFDRYERELVASALLEARRELKRKRISWPVVVRSLLVRFRTSKSPAVNY